jgi:hypothetical protein
MNTIYNFPEQWKNQSLASLETKRKELWNIHDSLDKKQINLEEKKKETYLCMNKVIREAAALKEYMATLRPSTLEDMSIILQLIKEEVSYMSAIQEIDEKKIISILAMVKILGNFVATGLRDRR